MAESVIIYAGSNKAGKLRRKAIKVEAKRQKKSVSDLVWELFEKHGSTELKEDLAAAAIMES